MYILNQYGKFVVEKLISKFVTKVMNMTSIITKFV